MKRLLSFVIAIAMVLTAMCGFATEGMQPELSIVTDYSTGITEITGQIGAVYADRWVNILILNPGFELDDFKENALGAINWAQQSRVNADGSFTLSMELTPLETSDNPVYTVAALVDAMETAVTQTFELYNQKYVDGVVDDIKAEIKKQDTIALNQMIQENAGLLGIDSSKEYAIYMDYDEESQTRVAQGIIEENPVDGTELKSSFLGVVATIELDACTDTTSYETALKPLLTYAATSVKKEIETMSEKEKTAFMTDLMEQSFNSPSGLVAELNQTLVLKPMNASLIWTEIAELYDTYADVLEIDTEDYRRLRDKKAPMASLLQQNFASLEEAAEAYEAAVRKQKNQENSNTGSTGGVSRPSGGGGSFGSGGTVSGPITIPTVPPVEPTRPDETVKPGETEIFTDLENFDWAAEAIETLAEAGIIQGYTETEFGPERTVTRAEFTHMFVKAFQIADGDKEMKFTDVQEDDWYYASVKAAYSAGYIQGVSEESFAPDAPITREDMAVILHRYLGGNMEMQTIFTDAESFADYAVEAIAALTSNGIIQGYEDGSFRPKANTLRAEAAVLIARILTEKGAL